MKTLGEKRVRVDFNTTSSDLVTAIKIKSVELIDLIETIKTNEVEDKGELIRHCSLAQTAIEEGAMYAVKAATGDYKK